MNKSVYSLVLSDEIVQEIDRMAYEAGASRSAMINQILADYVRYTTPEKRMRVDRPVDDNLKRKIALFCNVKPDCVIENLTVETLYEAPIMLQRALPYT